MQGKTFKKPMLAGECPQDLSLLSYPVLVLPKIDGIRVIIVNREVRTRSMKLLPNKRIQALLSSLPEGMDGELTCKHDPFNFQANTSLAMGQGDGDFVFWAFDMIGTKGFVDRYNDLEVSARSCPDFVRVVPHTFVSGVDELLAFERSIVSQGFEGVVVRSLSGPYKQGRSTTKEGHLLKLKRFLDDEAECVGVVELLHNENEAKTNEIGRTHRSSSKEGKVSGGTLGALVLRRSDGVEFCCGTGFTAKDRADLWENKPIGRLVKFKYLEAGVKTAPRHPVFLGFRDLIDMDLNQ